VFFFVSSGFYNNLVDQKSFYFFSWKLKKHIFKRKNKKSFKKFFIKVQKRNVN
jgi:hypothetical protein